MPQEVQGSMDLDPQIMIQTLQNTVAQQAISIVQLQAGLAQLGRENTVLKAELNSVTAPEVTESDK